MRGGSGGEGRKGVGGRNLFFLMIVSLVLIVVVLWFWGLLCCGGCQALHSLYLLRLKNLLQKHPKQGGVTIKRKKGFTRKSKRKRKKKRKQKKRKERETQKDFEKKQRIIKKNPFIQKLNSFQPQKGSPLPLPFPLFLFPPSLFQWKLHRM